jgi:hypothetical protein
LLEDAVTDIYIFDYDAAVVVVDSEKVNFYFFKYTVSEKRNIIQKMD